MRVYVSKKYRLDKLLPLTHKEIIELSNKDKDVLKQCVGINNSTHKMFYNCLKLTEIPQLNISHVTDTSYMFCRLGHNNPHNFYDKKFNKYVTISNKDLPQIDTSNVIDMSYMFANCKHKIPSVLNTLKVKNMSYTFRDCNIKELPQMDVRDVQSMEGMFLDNKSVPTNTIELDCTSVENLSYMFYNSSIHNYIKLKNVAFVIFIHNRHATIDCSYMYAYSNINSNLSSLFKMNSRCNATGMFSHSQFSDNAVLDFSSIKLICINCERMFFGSNVKEIIIYAYDNFTRMFQNCKNLTKVTFKNTDFNSTSTIGMFSGCSSLENAPNFPTAGNIKYMSEMFSGCKKLKTIPLYHTKHCIDMSHMFSYSGIQNIPLLDTSNVTNMSYMFMESDITTLPNLDTSNVTDMSYMFFGASKLTSLPCFNTSKVTTMKKMFAVDIYYNYDFYINTHDTDGLLKILQKIKNKYNSSKLYSSIRSDKIPNFDTVNVKNMSFMFENCFQKRWNQKLTANFNTENVVDMSYMFLFCLELISIPVFDIRNVKNIKNMLLGTKVTEVTFKNKPANLQITSEILCGVPNQITKINFV